VINTLYLRHSSWFIDGRTRNDVIPSVHIVTNEICHQMNTLNIHHKAAVENLKIYDRFYAANGSFITILESKCFYDK